MYKIFIYALDGKVTAIFINNPSQTPADGLEVMASECSLEQLDAEMKRLAPDGVGSPWPPVKR